jgi:hypothetical protein
MTYSFLVLEIDAVTEKDKIHLRQHGICDGDHNRHVARMPETLGTEPLSGSLRNLT